MDKLSKMWHFQWIKGSDGGNDTSIQENKQITRIEQFTNLDKMSKSSPSSTTSGQCKNNKNTSFSDILESILLWENSANSLYVVIAFNILFWGILILEIRGLAAVCGAGLVIALSYSTLEAQVEKERVSLTSDITGSLFQSSHIDKIMNKAKLCIERLRELRNNEPRIFCLLVCLLSNALLIIGRIVNGVFLMYALIMGILLGPGLLLKLEKKVLNSKEWESEMEEFLPVVDEDNLQLLNRAGETGDNSPTPPSGESDNHADPFDDDEMVSLKMPSHEDISIDGLELSDELELSCGEITNDQNALAIQSKHFDGISSSDEEELDLKDNDLSSNNSDDSESEFEVIDSSDIANLSSLSINSHTDNI